MDPTHSSAIALARAIRRREVSAAEVVAAHLARIEAVNPRLNAVVQLTAEAACQAAEAADQALARGEAVGPLHGVPFTVKDWLETQGVCCTAGLERWRHHIPSEDATAVARLRAAGAILLGKTNPMTDNVVYGKTFNPYRAGYSPAGSSSGEAAIIAAGGSPLGLGSDSGGSIRQPAHCCGIAGLKPTGGRVPLTGHLPPISALNDPRTVVGPLARSVDDLWLTLTIITGVDGRDASVIPMPLKLDPVALSRLRVAFYTAAPEANPTSETVATALAAAAVLEAAGVVVEAATPPRLDEVMPLTRAYWRRPESESWEVWEPDGEAQLPSLEVERSLFEWDRFRRAMLRFMHRYDAILTPVSDLPAVVHGSPEGSIAYTAPYSLTGYPCVVVRAGSSADGLPIGVQLVARPWHEAVALALAKRLETVLGGWRPPPLS